MFFDSAMSSDPAGTGTRISATQTDASFIVTALIIFSTFRSGTTCNGNVFLITKAINK